MPGLPCTLLFLPADDDWWDVNGFYEPPELRPVIQDTLKAVIWPALQKFVETATGSMVFDYLAETSNLRIE